MTDAHTTTSSPKTVGGLAFSGTREAKIADLETQLAYEKKRLEADKNKKEIGGDLAPGEVGYVVLDEDGAPSGSITKEPPAPGTPCARVVGAHKKGGEVLTPSGAPIGLQMNPQPDMHDAGLVERNAALQHSKPATAHPAPAAAQAPKK